MPTSSTTASSPGTYLEITGKRPEETTARLRNEGWMMDIPVSLRGSGAARFFKDRDGGKSVRIHPDIIRVFRKERHLFSMTDISVSRCLGTNTIEGIDSSDRRTPVMIPTGDVRLMWADEYRHDREVWNINL